MTNLIQQPGLDVFIPEADDGWTLPGYFAAVPNVHPEIRFRYRPFTPEERAHVLGGIARASSEKEMARLNSMALSQRLKWWDLTYVDKEGNRKPAPINLDFISRMRFNPWDRFMAVVIYQTQASDTDPQWSKEDKKLFDEASFKALIGGDGCQASNVVNVLEGN